MSARVVVGGFVLGISKTAVTPPSSAAVEPVSMSSFSRCPGSRKWTWVSMTPGRTCSPRASKISAAVAPRERAQLGDASGTHADIGGDETRGRRADTAADQEIEALRHRASSTVMMSPRDGAAFDVYPVPERVEQKLPAGGAFVLAAAVCRSRGTAAPPFPGDRSARCRPSAATSGASVRARFAIHSATGTVKPRLRENASAAGSARASHLRRMYLPMPFLILSASGKTERELGDLRVEERACVLRRRAPSGSDRP